MGSHDHEPPIDDLHSRPAMMSDSTVSDDASRGAPSPALDVVEHSDRRLVVHIPPQSSPSTRGLGVFATVWSVFSMAIAVFFVVADKGGPRAGIPSFAIGVPLLFVAIGAGMLYAWARMRHTRLFVLVDPARVAIQRQFFQRKRETEVEVGPLTHAKLVEAYSVNDVPVDAVTIEGGPRRLKFGISLVPADKAWLVEQINAIVCPTRTAEGPPVCSQCSAVLPVTDNHVPEEMTCAACGHREVLRPVVPQQTVIPEIRPERGDSVPEEITLRETQPDELAFSVQLISAAPFRQIAGWGGGVVWLIMLFVIGPGLFRAIMTLLGPAAPGAPGGGFPLVFLLFELVHGTLFLGGPLLVLFAILRGRIDVQLTRERLAMLWGAGWFRVRRVATLDQIDDVRLISAASSRTGRAQVPTKGHRAAAVIVKGVPWILTTFHPEPVALAAAGLVRTRLRDWNVIDRSPTEDLVATPDETDREE